MEAAHKEAGCLRSRPRAWASLAVTLSALITGSGCGGLSGYRTPQRFENGYTIILPGIEGRSILNANIAKGLARAGVPTTIEVYDWTAGSILLFPVTLRGEERNRCEARKIARKIMDYQDKYPDRPVYLIGHSGGGGLAIWVLEALPPSRSITSTILLGPAMAPDYDLRRALKRTQAGIWNFYSPHDKGFLGAGTTLFGTIDGQHTSAAGAVGFALPWGLDKDGRQLYGSRLHQQPYVRKMAETGHGGRHLDWAKPAFVAEWLAPIIHSQMDDQTHYASDEDDKPQ